MGHDMGATFWSGLRGAACALVAASSVVPAASFDSAYTRIDYEACPVLKETETGSLHRCAGCAGIPVVFDSDEHGGLIGFGPKLETTGIDWLARHFAEAEPTIEWRGRRSGARVRPVAAIVRMSVTRGESISGPRQPVLAAYRLPNGRGCVAALLDGARRGANADARRIADTAAQHFRCGRDRADEFLR